VTGLLAMLARYARPLLLLDAALLFGGVMLTSFNMLLVGWSVYVVGHALLIVALLALAAAHRARMDGWSWAGLLVLELGLILALPQAASIWQTYYNTPIAGLMLMPAAEAPVGRAAEGLTWIGFAFYALAGRGARALPGGVAWMFVAAAVIGLLAAFATVLFITLYWWVLAMFVVAFALVGAAGSVSDDDVFDDDRVADERRLPGASTSA
jgi:hypothetical protein